MLLRNIVLLVRRRWFIGIAEKYVAGEVIMISYINGCVCEESRTDRVGGSYDPTYSYDYIESLCPKYFGIPEVYLVKADMLDIFGNDTEKICE